MSTLRINNIEAQSIPASPTLDEKVKITNSSGDILVNIDGKTSGITTIGINTTDGNIKFDENSNVVVTGVVTATKFSGDFEPVHVNASGIVTASSFVGTGVSVVGVVTATSFVGSGANLTNLPVSSDDINNLINNVAILGFKVATNGSLAKYSLVNQVIDEFNDSSGIDASASTNENLTGGYYHGASASYPTGGTVTTYSSGGVNYRVHSFLSNANFVASVSGTADMLIVGGGGGGGNYLGGGGGGGEVLYVQNRTLSAGTYAVVRGNGGLGGQNNTDDGQIGSGSYFGSNYASTNLYARPGGAASGHGNGSASTSGTYATVVSSTTISGTGNGGGGASAGASAGQGATPTTRTVSAPSGETWTLYSNKAGGNGTQGGSHASGGGGGANGIANAGAWGNGGPGIQINIDGNNYYWGGGGGGGSITRPSSGGNGGLGGGGGGGHENNGGGSGGGSAINAGAAAGGHTAGGDAGANTGGGGGGGSHGDYDGGDGGTGIVIVRYPTNQFTSPGDLILQSVDTTAVDGAPTKADLIMLMENAAGTATLNTDIKGYISRDSGANFTQGTLVDEGSYGTSTKRIVAFHDLDISGQPSGTSVCYKITTHNQSASKSTRIHAVSHGWK